MRRRLGSRALLRDFLGDRKGNFAVMTALSVPFAVGLAAVAIDEGSLYTERREVQALADLAAITAAANIDKAERAVLATFEDNGLPSVTVRNAANAGQPTSAGLVDITPGHYTPDAAVATGKRFVPDLAPYNAVKVTLQKVGTLYFGSAIMAPPTISATAIASTKAEAALSIGSRLVKVDTASSPILNGLLGGLLGANISLSVMDYRALVDADINVLSFVDQLAIKLNMTGVNYADVLASKATVGQVFSAMAAVPGLDSRSRLTLLAMVAGATGSAQIPLSQLIDLGSVGQLALGQSSPGLDVGAGVLGMIYAVAALSNGSRQIDLGAGLNLAPLTNIHVKIAVGEPPQSTPWLRVGGKGAVARTAQTRIKLTADVAIASANPVAGLALASVSLPLNVEVAYGEAEITDISCRGGPNNRQVTVAARPGIASLKLAGSGSAGFGDFTKPQTFDDAHIAAAAVELKLLGITVLKLPLVDVTGRSDVDIGNTASKTLVFTEADIAARKPITVTTSNYTQSLTTSLLDNLDLHVSAAGMPLKFLDDVLNLVRDPLVTVLRTVTAPVDSLIGNLLTSLGIGLGQADVRITGATCGRAVLVQ